MGLASTSRGPSIARYLGNVTINPGRKEGVVMASQAIYQAKNDGKLQELVQLCKRRSPSSLA